MKSNQVTTRMSRKHIKIIAELARTSHMTFAAMLRRLVLERLEQIMPAADKEGSNEN